MNLPPRIPPAKLLPKKAAPVPRECLEATAHIFGPSSAAAKAIAEADRHDGPAYFYRYKNSIFVEKHPKPE